MPDPRNLRKCLEDEQVHLERGFLEDGDNILEQKKDGTNT